METPSILSKGMVFVMGSFLVAALIFSLYSIPSAVARISKGPIACSPTGGTRGSTTTIPGIKQVRCCQTSTDSEGITVTYCTYCDDTQPPNNCGPRFITHGVGSNPTVGPTQSGNGLPNTGATLGNTTGLPGNLGTVLSTGNNTRGLTNGQIGPPNHLGTVLSTGNTTNTAASPPLTLTKEHNNQQISGHHHNKGSGTSSSNPSGSSGSSSSSGSGSTGGKSSSGGSGSSPSSGSNTGSGSNHH